jgi:hypothetical protein
LPASMERRRLAIVGLSAVGKSTLVAALHGKSAGTPAPTAGCNKSSLTLHGLHLDLLDLGGSAQVRKFWAQLALEAHALVVVANAAEADDSTWAVLAGELRRLRAGRPVLLLLNRRDVPAVHCIAAAEAMERLGLDDASGVRVETLERSTDASAAHAGLEWLCATLLCAEPAADRAQRSALAAEPRGPVASDEGAASAEEAPAPVKRAPTRLRVVQALQDAREYQGPEAELAAALSQKLASGHLLTSDELARLRTTTAPP